MQDYLISPNALKKLQEEKKPLQLIDVRTLEKHEKYNIGGRLLPSEELPHQLDTLDRTVPIITYCTSGGRSMRALEFLLSAGFTEIKSLEGGMTRWQEEYPAYPARY
jgi:rhodanese-related sulfurtransferase